MEGIQLLQLVVWKYVTCEKNCPLDKAIEDTSPSGHRHISRKARGLKGMFQKEIMGVEEIVSHR